MDLTNLPLKKIGLGVLFAAIATAAGFGIYYLFFRAPEQAPPVNEAVNEIGGLPGLPAEAPANQIINEAPVNALPPTAGVPERVTKIEAPEGVDRIARGEITQVTTNFPRTAEAITVANGQRDPYFYNQEDGYFYKVSPQGTLSKLSNTNYPNVEEIAWSPNGDKAILEFPDGSNVLFNFKNNKQVTLPDSWQDFSFNEQGSKIAFKDVNVNLDHNFLAIANPDGSQQKYLEPIADQSNRVQINWSPSGHVVATYYEAKNSTNAEIFLIGQNGENYRSIDAKGFGVESKWLPDGKRLVYNSYNLENDNKPSLHIVDAYGDRIGYNHNDLGVNTWIDKCTFQGKNTMYCAVPKYLPENAGFQPAIADDIPDYIYKIDLNTGAKAIIAEPELTYSINSMRVSEDGKYLYFTDKSSGSVHYIQLK